MNKLTGVSSKEEKEKDKEDRKKASIIYILCHV